MSTLKTEGPRGGSLERCTTEQGMKQKLQIDVNKVHFADDGFKNFSTFESKRIRHGQQESPQAKGFKKQEVVKFGQKS